MSSSGGACFSFNSLSSFSSSCLIRSSLLTTSWANADTLASSSASATQHVFSFILTLTPLFPRTSRRAVRAVRDPEVRNHELERLRLRRELRGRRCELLGRRGIRFPRVIDRGH